MTNGNDSINVVDYINNDGTIQHQEFKGLTKREYFAAMAMQGIISSGNFKIGTITYAAVAFSDGLITSLNK